MRWSGSCLVLACLAAVPPAAGEVLDVPQVFGNAEGCEQIRTGRSASDLWLVLGPDSLEGAVLACTFTDVSTDANGVRHVEGLCSTEGEEETTIRRFVVAPDPADDGARLVFEDGLLWQRFAACPQQAADAGRGS